MNGRGGDAPSANDGEYLLQLLRKPPNSNPPTPSPQQQPSQTLSQDPAVAAIGPSIPTFTLPHAAFSSNGYEFPYLPWNASPPFVPHNYFQQNPNTNPNLNPDLSSPPGGYSYSSPQFDLQFKRLSLGDGTRKLDSYGDNSKPNAGYQQGQNLRFGSLNRDIMQNGSGDVLNQSLYGNSHLNTFPVNSVEVNENAGRNSSVFRGQKQEKSSNCNAKGKQSDNGSFRAVATAPGFSSNTKNVRNRDRGYNRGISDSSRRVNKNHRLANQLESPGLPAGSNLPSTSASDIEESMMELLDEGAENLTNEWQDKMNKNLPEKGDLEDELVYSLGLEDESGKKSGKKKPHRDKFKHLSLGDATRKLDSYGDNSKPNAGYQQGQNLRFGSLNRDIMQNGSGEVLNQSLYGNSHLNTFPVNSVEVNENAGRNSSVFRGQKQEKSSNCNARGKQSDNGSFSAVATPPGFSSNTKNVRNRDRGYNRGISDSSSRVNKNHRLANQLESPGLPAGSNLPSTSASDIEESMMELLNEGVENLTNEWQDKMNKNLPEKGDLEDELVDSLGLEDESGKKSGKKKPHHDKAYRSDKRGQWVADQSMRNIKRQMLCRNDINGFNAPLLDVFESLIPSDEEKVKQKQLLMLLEKLVGKEWPEAQLYLYGSCANSFGFSKSDIDVCLEMGLGDIEKSKVLLKLADVFQSDNMQNVQALTRARVPIVKLMDPVTGISCDICINNILAVVNTKLLHDYARIDARLRQLAFIVKHWAKSRGVNETYHGTLSSYAYVLMCIHFLQQRRPPILPCLQRMQITYFATVENVECAFFDDVEKIQSFGSQNGETIAQLVWAFFHYWAYCHDYGNDVISVRTGSTLNKRAKYWTRRVGYDRHLICIEDPFDVSHDLGRVVDKKSIKILREEFERAAAIMQHDPNPCVALFEPYIPN